MLQGLLLIGQGLELLILVLLKLFHLSFNFHQFGVLLLPSVCNLANESA